MGAMTRARTALLAAALPLTLASCAPAVNAVNRLNAGERLPASAPLAAGQTWQVDASTVGLPRFASVRIVELFQPSAGLYSNLDAAALQVAQQGRVRADVPLQNAISYSPLAREVRVYWNELGTDYVCRAPQVPLDLASNPTPLRGELRASGDVIGRCTVTLAR